MDHLDVHDSPRAACLETLTNTARRIPRRPWDQDATAEGARHVFICHLYGKGHYHRHRHNWSNHLDRRGNLYRRESSPRSLRALHAVRLTPRDCIAARAEESIGREPGAGGASDHTCTRRYI